MVARTYMNAKGMEGLIATVPKAKVQAFACKELNALQEQSFAKDLELCGTCSRPARVSLACCALVPEIRQAATLPILISVKWFWSPAFTCTESIPINTMWRYPQRSIFAAMSQVGWMAMSRCLAGGCGTLIMNLQARTCCAVKDV